MLGLGAAWTAIKGIASFGKVAAIGTGLAGTGLVVDQTIGPNWTSKWLKDATERTGDAADVIAIQTAQAGVEGLWGGRWLTFEKWAEVLNDFFPNQFTLGILNYTRGKQGLPKYAMVGEDRVLLAEDGITIPRTDGSGMTTPGPGGTDPNMTVDPRSWGQNIGASIEDYKNGFVSDWESLKDENGEILSIDGAKNIAKFTANTSGSLAHGIGTGFAWLGGTAVELGEKLTDKIRLTAEGKSADYSTIASTATSNAYQAVHNTVIPFFGGDKLDLSGSTAKTFNAAGGLVGGGVAGAVLKTTVRLTAKTAGGVKNMFKSSSATPAPAATTASTSAPAATGTSVAGARVFNGASATSNATQGAAGAAAQATSKPNILSKAMSGASKVASGATYLGSRAGGVTGAITQHDATERALDEPAP